MSSLDVREPFRRVSKRTGNRTHLEPEHNLIYAFPVFLLVLDALIVQDRLQNDALHAQVPNHDAGLLRCFTKLVPGVVTDQSRGERLEACVEDLNTLEACCSRGLELGAHRMTSSAVSKGLERVER